MTKKPKWVEICGKWLCCCFRKSKKDDEIIEESIGDSEVEMSENIKLGFDNSVKKM